MIRILIVMLAFFTLCCNLHRTELDVEDVTRPEQFSLTNQHPIMGQGFHLVIEVSGNIDGQAELILLKDDMPYRSKNLSGDVDFVWRENWSAVTAQVSYQPIDVRSGSLSLACEFKEN